MIEPYYNSCCDPIIFIVSIIVPDLLCKSFLLLRVDIDVIRSFISNNVSLIFSNNNRLRRKYFEHFLVYKLFGHKVIIVEFTFGNGKSVQREYWLK